MSRVIQMWGMATPRESHLRVRRIANRLAGLFSSALFCLWLSTASLVVWVDFGTHSAGQVASTRATPAIVAAAPTDAIKHH
jgi:hypothetical protein